MYVHDNLLCTGVSFFKKKKKKSNRTSGPKAKVSAYFFVAKNVFFVKKRKKLGEEKKDQLSALVDNRNNLESQGTYPLNPSTHFSEEKKGSQQWARGK